ncbi:NGG1p interacting factor 3 [Tilletiaria anomala UBC 951]|uniref:NGG1p interacting factor 3 n=1 Tax=Tilletiaria anomala (strain ATCC 24038 / CBS 436.72 / UBC 951) TaxID=1037660 RepID=A0A066VYE2_TILAU|nr:NGG1p interacting factor 3 [Tilletiaria anomala UBC 951]KDN43560.1 NGG1p interacting factor 3 [Tilletiaria anomala UBC 951]
MASLLSGIYKGGDSEATPRIPPPPGACSPSGDGGRGSGGGVGNASSTSTATFSAAMESGGPPIPTPLKAVSYAMSKIAPLSLADTTWDNVGVLLEAPFPRRSKGVFLAIDLTPAVADELLSDANSSISVAIIYHPCIFKPLKALSWSASSDGANSMLIHSLLRLSAAGISIYTPHSALDSAPNGMNDWLAFVVSSDVAFQAAGLAALGGGWAPIQKTKVSQYIEKAGLGRLVSLKESRTIEQIVSRIKKHLRLKYVLVAQAQPPDHQIETIAVQVGSGGSVLQGVYADLYVTGEMSHHELLAANSRGISVILLHHSNSERGYLQDVLVHLLHIFLGEEYGIRVSARDHEPLSVM